MPPKYRIEKISDFLKVPSERLDDCLAEFKTCLEMHRAMNSLFVSTSRAVMAEEDPANVELLEQAIQEGKHYLSLPSFNWIDDGEKNITMNLRSENAHQS